MRLDLEEMEHFNNKIDGFKERIENVTYTD
jgi:hypothetical protein